MKQPPVVILCGGFGTRLREYPGDIPKPLVPVGGRPILWHIMKGYAHHGFDHFILCLGYKSEAIRNYFVNFALYEDRVSLELDRNAVRVLPNPSNSDTKWKVELVDTGIQTLTGGRIRKIAPLIKTPEFFVSYGDTLCDINFQDQLRFHRSHGAEVTVTGVRQSSRFGHIETDAQNKVTGFTEKPLLKEMVSGGFLVLKTDFVRRIKGDQISLESEPIAEAARLGQAYCYKHAGFWTCMDTYRDYEALNQQYANGPRPWMVWEPMEATKAA